jgi:DNA gyrase/topoisomerase IV subunit A
VIVQADVQKGSFLAMFDAKDGREVWRVTRTDVPTWSTPTIHTVNGRTQIIVKELPYQVNKSVLQERIAELVREKKIEGIAAMEDHSDRQGMRLVIEVKRDANPHTVLNHLYKHTAMQQAFGYNMLALVGGQPQLLPLKRLLVEFLDYRQIVLTRRRVRLVKRRLARTSWKSWSSRSTASTRSFAAFVTQPVAKPPPAVDGVFGLVDAGRAI